MYGLEYLGVKLNSPQDALDLAVRLLTEGKPYGAKLWAHKAAYWAIRIGDEELPERANRFIDSIALVEETT